MDIYGQIATKIIEQQELVIGPVAVQQAQEVEGLVVNWGDEHSVVVDQVRAPELIDKLVGQYAELFGQIAIVTSKEVASRYSSQLTPDKIPKSLQ